MRGSLGRVVPSAATDTSLYVVSVNCSFALVDIFVLNPDGAADANIEVSIAPTGTPGASHYIEKGTAVTKGGGTHEIISRQLSPGDNVIVRSNLANTVFRIEGSEEVLY